MEDESEIGRASTMASEQDSSGPAKGLEDLRVGLVLSETYRLTSLLGRGGMGEVWKAEHLRLPKSVAIKVLLADMASNSEVEARFRREAEIGSRLAHPHIVHVFDFNELPDGRKYIAMDFLQGESLAERMERGPIPYEEIVHILKQTAMGLQVAHDAGVVHRDLKPDNIFLCTDPNATPPFRVKILDFGISKIQNAERTLTQDMAVMGTPGYMAPEQARGQTSTLGPEADQFSLATIAYEMVSGNPAFEGQTLVEIIFKLVHEDPQPIDARASGVPEHAAQALGRAMSKEPSGRFDTIAAFVATFSGLAAPLDVEAATLPADPRDHPLATPQADAKPRPVAAAEPASENSDPSRKRLIAGLVVALLGAGLAAFAWYSSKRQPGDDAPQVAYSSPTLAPPVVTAEISPKQAAANAAAFDAALSDSVGDAARGVDAANDAAHHDKSASDEPRSTKPTHRRPEPRTALTPAAQALVQQAEAALASGNGSQALTLAEKALREQDSPQARAARAKAYCLKRDLGGANAAKRGLPRVWLRRVDKFCNPIFK